MTRAWGLQVGASCMYKPFPEAFPKRTVFNQPPENDCETELSCWFVIQTHDRGRQICLGRFTVYFLGFAPNRLFEYFLGSLVQVSKSVSRNVEERPEQLRHQWKKRDAGSDSPFRLILLGSRVPVTRLC